jgi:UrcA family protein
MTRTATLFAAAVALMIAAPAMAQTADDAITVSVQYADLDVGHAAGAKILLQRIEAAATTACGGEPDLRLLGERAGFDRCKAATVAQALRAVDAPMVTAMANGSDQPVILAQR